ncbi:MAG: hypothetical protein K2I11_06460, partial [Bacteroides sp.]|nr:hypothetical protein [Bacteroides sp.]
RKSEKHSETISGGHEKLMGETMVTNIVVYATSIEQDISFPIYWLSLAFIPFLEIVSASL